MGREKTEFFSWSEHGESSERVARGAAASWVLRQVLCVVNQYKLIPKRVPETLGDRRTVSSLSSSQNSSLPQQQLQSCRNPLSFLLQCRAQEWLVLSAFLRHKMHQLRMQAARPSAEMPKLVCKCVSSCIFKQVSEKGGCCFKRRLIGIPVCLVLIAQKCSEEKTCEWEIKQDSLSAIKWSFLN